MDVNGATAVLKASPEGVAAESDPEPRVPSEESPKSPTAAGACQRSTHGNILSEDTQCSTPKDATPHLGDPKEATGAPHLPDTFKMDNSPSTEAVSIKGTAHEPSNQEKNGTTSPPKGKLPDPKAADGVKKDAKAAGVPTGAKRNIPAKRDRMDPLKLDMTKPTVMPLTSSQLSLQCLECHIIFSDDKSKQRHLKMSHPAEYEQCMLGDSLFACYVCDRHFANSTELMAHQRTHTEKQPFKCLLCGEAFKRSSELTTHKKLLHYSSQGYKCSDCGKACKTLTLLKYHSRTHTGEKPYVCKECGKRFSMPKALQRHIESHTHDEGEENGDETNAAAKSKKQKSNSSSERKYSCPHCKAMFKTEKTQLHHIKLKHSQSKSIAPSQTPVTQHPLSQGPPPPLLTQATIGQPPVLRLDSGGQTPQCIEPEQIKRLIESLGNVQKVNQLVIYGLEPVSFQSQTMNLQPVPGVVQPIRFDMTQTVPSVELKMVTEDSDQAKQQNEFIGPELIEGQGVINAHYSVEETTRSDEQMQDQTGPINSESSQLEFDRISEGTEKAVEVACRAVETKTVETGQDNGQIQMLEWQQSSSLIPTNELENENSHMVSLQEEVVQMQYMTPSDTLSLVATNQTVDQIVTLTPVETQIVTLTGMEKQEDSKNNARNDGEQDVGQTHLISSDMPKDRAEQTEANTNKLCSELHFSEEISIHTQPSLHDSDAVETHTQPCLYGSDAAEVVTAGEHEPCSGVTAKLSAPVKLKKGRTAKKTNQKAKSKTQISDITLKQQTDHNGTVLTSQQKVLAPHPSLELKTTETQQSRAKSHILVQFGNRNKKEKLSKTVGPSKRSKKGDDIKQQAKADSQLKKMGGNRKGKTSKSGNKIQTEIMRKPPDAEQQVMQKEDSKSLVWSRKRKLKIHKVTNSTLIEKEVISAPLPKKKRQEKNKKTKAHKRTSKKEVIKKTLKVKQKEKEETPATVLTNQVKADALLLLKGHKQPQLKVHKLDAPCPSSVASSEVAKMAPLKQMEDQKNKLSKAKAAKRPIQTCDETPCSTIHKSTPIHKKVKVTLGRKKKTKAHGKFALTSPPLTCDCGVKFSEVSALQEHMATAHVGETCGHHDNSSGTHSEVQEQPNNSVGPKTLELQVTTDWDAELEMGEIGLGDKEDQQVSFPALNPSPSLPHAPSSVDGEYEDAQKDGRSAATEKRLEVVCNASAGSEQPQSVISQESSQVSQTPSQELPTDLSKPEQVTVSKVQKKSAFSPLPRKHQERTSNKVGKEASGQISEIQDVADVLRSTESDKTVEEDMKDDLLLDVNLVTVQDEDQLVTSLDGDLLESCEEDGQIASKIKEMPSHQNEPNLHTPNGEIPSRTKNPVVDLNSNITAVVKDSSTDPPEIKQEDVEMAVYSHNKTSGQNRSNTARGRKRGGGGGRGRRGTSKKRNMGSRLVTNQEPLNDDPDECQIVYQLYPVAADSEERSMEGNGPQVCTNPPRSAVVESQEDSSEEQVVFELESVTTSVDVVKSEAELDSQDRTQGSSPGILLEKFLTSRGSRNNESTGIPKRVVCDSTNEPNNEGSTDHITTTLPSLGTSGVLNVKEENQSQPVMPPLLTPEGPDARVQGLNRSLSSEQQQNVQMFVVKEEDPLVLNEPQIIQQPCNGKRRNGDLCSSTAAVSVPPVENNIVGKEIETAASTAQQPSAKQCIFFPVKEEERELLLDPSERVENQGTATVEEYDDICEISAQHETQCVDSAFEDDDMGAEQHNTEELLKFLLQSSDTEDSGCIDSEPEAETLAMSCYHGSRSTGSANPPVKLSQEANHSNNNQLSQKNVSSQNGQRNPIDYFAQYFDCKTWQDVAAITAKTSKMSNPVTAKEVSQFVGIHIAMGTLQFPSIKLYWEDCTRVALIADAMSASRFSELLSKLKIAEEGGSSISQRKEKAASTNSMINHSGQMCNTQSPLTTDPLNRVHVLVEKVQKACQALKREGSHGINQHPLWLLRSTASPVYSLHHTVMLSTCGLVVDFNLSLDDSDREETVKNMVLSGQNSKDSMVFLCKPELSTPSMLDQLLEAGVQSAGKVGGARGQVGDEFVSSDGKLKLFRCHHGFILSAAVKGRSRSTSLVSGFERALKAAKLNRDLRNAYRTPCLSSSPAAWPLSVLWHLMDLALVNSWLQYRGDCSHEQEPLSLMAFRLEVSKALIFSSSADAQDATPPQPPAPQRPEQATVPGSPSIFETPLPDTAIRYDGVGHWPEQVGEGEGARCRFGGCERTSRVRCLKCCVFLCISRNHNCFLKFHSQGT